MCSPPRMISSRSGPRSGNCRPRGSGPGRRYGASRRDRPRWRSPGDYCNNPPSRNGREHKFADGPRGNVATVAGSPAGLPALAGTPDGADADFERVVYRVTVMIGEPPSDRSRWNLGSSIRVTTFPSAARDRGPRHDSGPQTRQVDRANRDVRAPPRTWGTPYTDCAAPRGDRGQGGPGIEGRRRNDDRRTMNRADHGTEHATEAMVERNRHADPVGGGVTQPAPV